MSISDEVDQMYAQLHHEPSRSSDFNPKPFVPTATRHVSNNSVMNRPQGILNNPGAGRYWRMPGQTNTIRANTPFNKQNYQRPWIRTDVNSTRVSAPGTFAPPLPPPLQNNNVSSVAARPRPFSTYTSVLNFMEPEKSKKSVFTAPTSNARKRRSAKIKNRNQQGMNRMGGGGGGERVREMGPTGRSTNPKTFKEIRMGKNLEKIRNAKRKGGNSKSVSLHPSTTIVLEDTESEEDDVIVIPTPDPPMVSIDSSSDEDTVEGSESHEFVLPLASNISNRGDQNSRPVSPSSSVMSADDFIAQNDRDRIRANERSQIAEEDLQCTLLTVDNVLNASRSQAGVDIVRSPIPPLTESTTSNAEVSVQLSKEITPEEDLSKNSGSEIISRRELQNTATTINPSTIYAVTESIVRPVDVYESESSDIPDSVYFRSSDFQKKSGDTTTQPSLHNSDNSDTEDNLNVISSVSDSVEGRTKKFTKRKSSDNNEINSDSGDDPEIDKLLINEYFNDRKRQSTTHIKRGAGIDNRLATNAKHKKTEDDDFVAMLSNLVHGDINDPDIHIEETVGDTDGNGDDAMKDASNVCVKDKNETDKCNIDSDVIENAEVGGNDKKIPQPGEIQSNLVVIDSIGETDEIEDTVVIEDDVIENLNTTNKEVIKVEHRIGWNSEMESFYNDSWGGENFDVNQIRRKMKDSKSDWKICTEDRHSSVIYNRDAKTRCRNCNELGHRAVKCKIPRKPILCSFCGDRGHLASRCRRTMCLQCGAPSPVIVYSCYNCKHWVQNVCRLCKVKGHSQEHCPDKWRRYHSTTNENVPLTPDIGYRRIRHCSVCSKSGHFAESCRSLRFQNRNLPNSKVMSYKPAYPMLSSTTKSPSQSTDKIGVLLTSVGPDTIFNRERDTRLLDRRSFYRRFLNATQDYSEQNDSIDNNSNDDDVVMMVDDSQNLNKPKMMINPFAKNALQNFSFSKEMEKVAREKFNFSTEFEQSTLQNFSFSKELEKLSDKQQNEFNLKKLSTVACEVSKSGAEDDTSPPTPPSPPHIEINIQSNEESPVSEKETSVILPVENENSNYSFSEFYRSDDNSEPTTSSGVVSDKIVGSYAGEDFISLNTNADSDDVEMSLSRSTSRETLEESPNHDELECNAKIYIKKEFNSILNSPRGDDIIALLTGKYKVSIKMDEHVMGNILNVTGKPSEQDRFQKELYERTQLAYQEEKLAKLEKSLQVPKHKPTLIRYIAERLDHINSAHEDVHKIYGLMRYNESLNSNSSLKRADKLRCTLNMILLGKTGLNDGHLHTIALENILANLRTDDDTVVTVQLRSEVFNHMKYIFSPFENGNYEKLIAEYSTKQVKCKRPEIDEKTEPPKIQPTTTTTTTTVLVSDEIEKCPVTVMPDEQLTDMSTNSETVTSEPIVESTINVFEPSDKWSQKCLEIIEKCLAILTKAESMVQCDNISIEKLQRDADKAKKNLLSHSDYNSLLKLKKSLRLKLRQPVGSASSDFYAI